MVEVVPYHVPRESRSDGHHSWRLRGAAVLPGPCKKRRMQRIEPASYTVKIPYWSKYQTRVAWDGRCSPLTEGRVNGPWHNESVRMTLLQQPTISSISNALGCKKVATIVPPPDKQLQRTVIRRRRRGASASPHCAHAPCCIGCAPDHGVGRSYFPCRSKEQRRDHD
jgi:hypothetical protein